MLGATPEQKLRIVYPSLALLLMTAAFILTKSGRDSLYFQKDGLFDLPWAYLGVAFLSMPVAAFILTEIRAVGPRRVRIFSPLVMAVLQAAFYLLAKPGGGWVMTLFFMLIPLAYGVLFSMAWLLGADLLDEVPEQHLPGAYATLGAASMLGGLVGGLSAKLLAPYLVPQLFILMGAVSLCASAAVTVVAQKRFPAGDVASDPQRAIRKQKWLLIADLVGTLKQSYVRFLLAVAMLASLVGVFIEFQFYMVAATSGSGGRENAEFFANFYILLTGASLLLQVLAMPALQRRIGIDGSLLILPLSLFGGSTMLAVSASGVARTALRIVEGGLKSSIHRSNWEQAYLPLDQARRTVTRVIVDGMGSRMAEGLAAAILLVWLKLVVGNQELVGLDIRWVTYLILVGTLLWLAVTSALGHRLAPQHCAEIRNRRFRPNAPLPDS